MKERAHMTFAPALRLAGLAAGVALVAGVVGCGSATGGARLETGYRYEPIGKSEPERRAFYRDRFSIEARRADAHSGSDSQFRGTRPGGR